MLTMGDLLDADERAMIAPDADEPRKLFLPDCSALYWRAYFAMGDPIDAGSYALDRLEAWREWNDVVACWDSGTSFRKAIWGEYKANRKPDTRPPSAWEGLRWFRDRTKLRGVPIAEAAGFEADDIQATLASQTVDPTFIVSDDKDLVQTLTMQHVRLVAFNGTIRTADDARAKFGVDPSQFIDFLALSGDVADNIPGCPGIGPGKATALLDAIGPVARISVATKNELQAVKGIGAKLVESIQGWDPTIALKLVALRYDAPVNLERLLKEGNDDGKPANAAE